MEGEAFGGLTQMQMQMDMESFWGLGAHVTAGVPLDAVITDSYYTSAMLGKAGASAYNIIFIYENAVMHSIIFEYFVR